MNRNLLFNLVIALLALLPFSVDAINLVNATGWRECASISWEHDANADSYNVYYSGNGQENVQVDPQLIRQYPNYFRADIPGLPAGSYVLKVVPVSNQTEGEGSVSQSVEVSAFDRTGFAFSNGRMPGAYQSNGMPKENAVVLYITENTKNKVSLEVTGANENPCVGLQEILEGFKKGKDTRPLIIRFVGQITDLDYMLNGDIVVENNNNAQSHITLEGIGEDAVVDGWGIRIKNASNIEIRNLGLMNCDSGEGDNIGLQQNNEYVWIHHCDFFYGGAGGDSDQAKGDGALDCKKSTYVTFSYNHFWDTGKSNLLGLSEGTTEGYYITYHHNWYDHSDSRHPRVRYYSAHVYNNYYDGNSKYGVGSTMGSSVFVEGNYFRNCKYPMLTSMQGSDVWDASKQANDYSDMPTFSKEDGGTIKAFNNYMEDEKRFVPYAAEGFPNSTTDFDAYVVSTRNEVIGAEVASARGGNTYNNFDTHASIMYTYAVETPEQAMETVKAGSGRMNGGDFSWTFNNAVDDASYAVNGPLKTALTTYQTSLIAIQGDSVSSGGGNGGGNGGGGSEITGDVVHNFTLSGLTSDYFNISGNLSDSKGTVNFAGLTLTQCLKIESSTNIAFTTTEQADLLLVFNEGFSGEIKVNSTSYPISNGLLTLPIAAGTYAITKDNSANLYYMAIDYVETSTVKVSQNPVWVLYPNPAKNQLFIQSNHPVDRISVFQVNGQLVKESIGDVRMLEVGELQNGNYILKIESAGNIIVKRLMVN